MEYYSGLLALSQYACENDDSAGLGSDAEYYLKEAEKYVRDTDSSKLGSVEIFSTVLIPTGEVKMCASHARAYCDMLLEHDFEGLKDIYLIAIKSYSVLNRIFLIARNYGLLRDKEIVKFLNDEFGSYFRGHLLTIGEDKVLAGILEEY